MSETCSFNLEHYKYCIELAKSKNYRFLTMQDYVKQRNEIGDSDKVIILRHDIDFDLSLAPNVAKMESELGVPATYFIRIHGKYNLSDMKNYKIIKEMLKMKHELGLHYDAGFSSLFNEDEESFFKRDLAIFENILGQKISGVSIHEPTRTGFILNDDTVKKFGLLYQGTSDIFMKEMKYISDSSCRWREGCMCNFIKNEVPKLCILTHPFWWFKQSPVENWC